MTQNVTQSAGRGRLRAVPDDELPDHPQHTEDVQNEPQDTQDAAVVVLTGTVMDDAPQDSDGDSEGAAPGEVVGSVVGLSWADPSVTRPPVLPVWVRPGPARRAAVRQIRTATGYHAGFHAVRVPWYLALVGVYAPVGACRAVGRLLRWARAETHNFELRQHAANTADAYTWQALNKTRAREARGRWWAVGLGTVAVLIVLAVLAGTGVLSSPVGLVVGVAVVLLSARYGRPTDRPIVSRVSGAKRFTKLTGEMVSRAIVAVRVAGVRDPETIEHLAPGVHRDGPGWLSRVNLPEGVTAVQVLERRAALASALRLPVDQVWPTAGPDHPGQLELWVGYQPASAMGQPKWSLTAENARTSVFEPHEFASDERGRPVCTTMFQRSYLIGGQPGSGKTFAGGALLTIALLDPIAETKVAEFKGTGDFLDIAHLCSTYICGVDDTALDEGAALCAWLVAEAERRGTRIMNARKRGLAPEGKVTPELAAMPGSGLHPIVVVIDEAHELFGARPQAADDCERAIKRLRALSIIIVLATQIPDKDSLPSGITRCVTDRWCLSVAGQVENDMILGTSAYKRGLTGTVYRPVYDAGWGCMTGGKTPISARSQFPDPAARKAIVARATSLRGGQAVGSPMDTTPARDLLADLTAVSASNGQWWSAAAPALVERYPDAYPHLTDTALSELARAAGLDSVGVKIGGVNRRGYRRADLDALRAATEGAAAGPQDDRPDGPDASDEG